MTPMRVVRARGYFLCRKQYLSAELWQRCSDLTLKKLRKSARITDGIAELANYNCPGQIVISGEEAGCRGGIGKIKRSPVQRRVARLKMSAAHFIRPCLKVRVKKPGKARFQKSIFRIQIFLMWQTRPAEYVHDASQIRDLLIRQVSSSVRWEQSVRKMLADGVDTFIEIGPGQNTGWLMKRIDRKAVSINIGKVEDLEKLKTLQ